MINLNLNILNGVHDGSLLVGKPVSTHLGGETNSVTTLLPRSNHAMTVTEPNLIRLSLSTWKEYPQPNPRSEQICAP